MKKGIKEITNENLVDLRGKMINRKDAIRKGGYIALSAATMMLLLSKPDKAVASSPAPVDPWGP